MKLPLLVLLALSAFFAGCASGPSYSDYQGSIPAVAADKGRIYFYRTAVMGAAIQPAVKVNGVKVGSAKPNGFFYYDVVPGEYAVETTTEVKRKLTLTMEKGQTRYVRLGISLGFLAGHVYPELVDTDVGAKEIASCKYAPGEK